MVANVPLYSPKKPRDRIKSLNIFSADIFGVTDFPAGRGN